MLESNFLEVWLELQTNKINVSYSKVKENIQS